MQRFFFLLFSERFYSSSCQKKYSSSPDENFSSFCQKKRIKYSSSSSLRGVVIFNYIFLFLSMNRKIFSSFYFSIMKVKELFLVNPHDHSTPPNKIKIFSSLSILPKEEEKNILKLFFYSETKNCRLPSLNGIILLLIKIKNIKIFFFFERLEFLTGRKRKFRWK